MNERNSESTERDNFPIVSDTEQVKGMNWDMPGIVYDAEDNDASLKITRNFESLNNVILDGEALRYFKARIEETYSPK